MLDIKNLKKGDYIRSYDFEPLDTVSDAYIEGFVTEFDAGMIGIAVFKSPAKGRVGTMAYTAAHLFLGEWNGRLSISASPDNGTFIAFTTELETI